LTPLVENGFPANFPRLTLTVDYRRPKTPHRLRVFIVAGTLGKSAERFVPNLPTQKVNPRGM
jgi:hypothetical protein